MKLTLEKTDTLGAVASFLCLLHCIATPFIIAFIPSLFVNGSDMGIVGWKNIDFIFLAVSFFAVSRSSKTTHKQFIKIGLWISWICLFLLIFNEKFEWSSLLESITYASALSLSALHIYNLKYCKCESDSCCADYNSK
jgi:hypothetical protein